MKSPTVVIEYGVRDLKAGMASESGPRMQIRGGADLEQLYQRIFGQLGVNPQECAVLMGVPAGYAKKDASDTAEILFRTFGSPALYVANQAVLSLYDSGRMSGVVVDMDSGDVTSVIGGVSSHTPLRLSADTADNFLRHALAARGYPGDLPVEVVRDLMERACYVLYDEELSLLRAESSPELERNYELPDGQVITIGAERFRCPEVFFKPYLIGLEQEGIETTTYNTIMKFDMDIRKDLYANVNLSGAYASLPGMQPRMLNELKRLAGGDADVRVSVPQAWRGGARLASDPRLDPYWLMRGDYPASILGVAAAGFPVEGLPF